METQKIKSIWPDWEVVRRIGTGSYGTVYEVEREMFGHKEKAAVKVISIPKNESDIDELRTDGYDQKSITARFQDYMQTVVREYSMMAEMKGCANIVYCDDVKYIQNDDGMGWDIFIKMELLTPLAKTLSGEITEEQVIKIGTDMSNALAFCEQHNVLHRDIKPQNIFVAADGTYKLGDFGVAKTVEKTLGGTVAGTYNYMAPEVYSNRPYGAKADIYSLGLVLYWLLNEKRLPFLPLPPAVPTAAMEESARIRRFQGEPIPAPVNGSAGLQRIVLKACEYDPKDRFSDAEEMRRQFAACSGTPEEGTVGLFGMDGDDEETLYGPSTQTPECDEKPLYFSAPFDYGKTIPNKQRKETSTPDPIQDRNKKKKLWVIPAAAVVLTFILGIFLFPKLINTGDTDEKKPQNAVSIGAEEGTSIQSARLYQPIKTERFGNSLYELYDVGLSWREARDYCDSIGGHMLTITTQSEQSFVTDFARDYTNLVWIGLEQQDDYNTGKWINGDSEKYTNWGIGEPSVIGGKAQMLCRPTMNMDVGDWRCSPNEGGNDEFYRLSNVGFVCEYEQDEACDWIVYKNNATSRIEMVRFPKIPKDSYVSFNQYSNVRLSLADGNDIRDVNHYYLNSAYIWEYDNCWTLSDAKADNVLFASVKVKNINNNYVIEPSEPDVYCNFEICNQVPQNNAKQYWIVFEEGNRNNQVEMSVFQHDTCQVIWNNEFFLRDGSDFGICKQYSLNEFGQWEYARDYNRISNYAPKIIASNVLVLSETGKELIAPCSDASFIGIAALEAYKQGTVVSLRLSNKYTYVIDDCSWQNAFSSALKAGGHLIRIETEEEYRQVTRELNALGLSNIEFRVAARRDDPGDSYYWVDENNQFVGDKINDEGCWSSDKWCDGEPSFIWENNAEIVLEIYYDTMSGSWIWNDISDEVKQSNIGEYGYIIEYK